MKQYKYLIIGGGLAGDAATRGIRELDMEGSIGLISAEPDAPYMRPNLSKGLWKGRPIEKIWRRTDNLGDFGGLTREEILQIAEDCTQHALIAVINQLSDFRGESKFTTWAYKFAVNIALFIISMMDACVVFCYERLEATGSCPRLAH